MSVAATVALACSVETPRFTAPLDAPEHDAPPVDAPEVDAPPDALIDAVPDAPPDAAPDAAPGPIVVATSIPLRIAVGESVAVTFSLSGPPNAVTLWSITSGGGAFAPASGVVVTNSGGLATVATNYTAPATAGDRAHVLTLDATNAPFETRVRVLRTIGPSTPFPDTQGLAIGANTLAGQAIVLPDPVVVMRLGLIAQTGGFQGRMALYRNGASTPTTLVAATNLASITGVPQELPVLTPVAVPAGTYWVMANFDAAAPILRASTSTSLAFVSLTTASGLPDPIAAAQTTNRGLNYYVVVTD